jgi:hypothetical protein
MADLHVFNTRQSPDMEWGGGGVGELGQCTSERIMLQLCSILALLPYTNNFK